MILGTFEIRAISRLNNGNSDSLLVIQNTQGGIRDVTDKESNIAQEGQRKRATNSDYAAPNLSHHLDHVIQKNSLITNF